MDPTIALGEAIAQRLFNEISTRPLTVRCGTTRALLAENRPFSDPYECLLWEGHAGFMETVISRQRARENFMEPTSTYDGFAALCAAMPQWAGHPLYAAMHGVLATVLNCHLPMNAENAPEIWRFCAAKLTEEDIGPKDVWVRMGVGTVYFPTDPIEYLDPSREDMLMAAMTAMDGICAQPLLCASSLTDPQEPLFWCPLTEKETRPFEDLAAYTRAITTAVERFAALGGTRTEITLPRGWKFQCPDPYHANAALQKAMVHETLTDEEAHLLATQTIRIWGQACAKAHLTLAVEGGDPLDLAMLTYYLQECDGYEKITFFPARMWDNPTAACDLLYGKGVSLGLSLVNACTPETIREKLIAYAANAPVGCLSDVYLPISTATDLWTLREARRILCDLLAQWADHGYAPKDLPTLTELAKII